MTSHHSDITRKESVLVQAKAILDGNGIQSSDFILTNRQMSWVYGSLNGNHSPIQAVFNNPLLSASKSDHATVNAKTFDTHNSKDDADTDDEGDEFTFPASTHASTEPPATTTDEQLATGAQSPNSEKRRMGSNRGMIRAAKTKRAASNGTLDSIKAILSPATTRRKSLVPFESLKTQTYIP